MRVGIMALLLLVGCVESKSVRCLNGRVCPAGNRCDDTSGLCVPATCGDGMLEPGEACDGTPTQDCTDYGFYFKGNLTCSSVCQVDTSECGATCGDRVINGPELCDGIPPAGRTCADLGLDVGRVACSASCGPGIEACGFVGWRDAPGGGTNELHAISGQFAVGLGGQIVHAGDDDVWTPMPSPTTADLFGVWTGSNGAFAVGAGGTIVHYTTTTGWTTMQSPTTNTLEAVFGAGDQVYAVGAAGTIVHYDGTTWTTMTPSPAFAGTLRGVWVDSTTGYAVGDGGAIFTLQGSTWTRLAVSPTTVQLNAVFGVGGHAFASGNQDVVLHYDPATSSWSAPLQVSIANVGALQLYAIWGSSPTNVFIGGDFGVMVHFDGAQLVEQGANTGRTIFGLSGNATDHVYGVTRGGEVIESNGTDRIERPPFVNRTTAVYSDTNGATATIVGDGGVLAEFNTQRLGAWTSPVTIAGGSTLTSVWRTNGLLVVGAANGLWVSTSGMSGSFANPVTSAINGVYGVTTPTERMIAVGAGIYTSTDGTTWTQQQPPGTTLSAVWATNNGSDWFAVGAGGVILHGNGTAWTPMTSGVTTQLSAVWGTSAQDVYVVGQLGTILHHDGTTWRPHYTGTAENLSAVSGSSRDDVFAGGTNGILFHYDGVAFSRMTPVPYRLVLGMFVSQVRSFFVGGLTGGAELFTRTCVATEERCDNPWDDDCDGLTNCDDPDCATSFACVRGGACPTFEHLDCGQVSGSTYTGIANIDELPCLPHSTPGPEASYKFKATQSGPVTATLTAADDLDLVVLDEHNAPPDQDGACAIQTCRAATGSGGTKSVEFEATAGKTYYFVIDGPLYTARDFGLSVSIACP